MPAALMGRAAAVRGFTLVELLVCLALLSLLTIVSLPYVTSGSGSLRLEADARVLAALLRAARERALAERVPVTVRLDIAVPGVTAEDEAGPRRLASVERLRVVTPRGEAGGQVAAIAFLPDGGSSGAVVIMQGDDMTRSLRVDWLTGAVTLEEP